MSEKKYRVGVDCRLAGRRHAGIGRYIENLIRELLSLPAEAQKDVQWVFFFSDHAQATQVLETATQIQRERCEVIIVPAGHYSFIEQVQLPRILHAAKLDLLHIPHFNIPLAYTGKIVVTIHDLLWHEYRGAAVTTLPGWLYWPKYAMYRLIVEAAVRRAEHIIVPAQTVKEQVLSYYPFVKEKITAVAEGIERRFFQPLLKNEHAKTKNLVYVGSLYPHKNLKVVIDALGNLPDYTLQIISSRSVFTDQVKKYVITKRLSRQVEFLGYQTDAQVAEFLKNATALVQPSLSEGFGLTGLEAMAAGTVVIASDIPIFCEVYHDHAICFDPKLPSSFIDAVHETELIDRPTWLKDAQEFAKTYQWQKMTEKIYDIYRQVLP
jgi:glycosyltransferase involved in cell wall biosynthesis